MSEMNNLRPMTFDEVVQCANDGIAIWEEIADFPGHFETEDPARQLKYHDARGNYGKIWRDWPRKPTEAQAAAVAWEDE